MGFVVDRNVRLQGVLWTLYHLWDAAKAASAHLQIGLSNSVWVAIDNL